MIENSQELYLLNLLKNIIIECEDAGISNIYENKNGNEYREDFPTELGKLLGEARIAVGEFN